MNYHKKKILEENNLILYLATLPLQGVISIHQIRWCTWRHDYSFIIRAEADIRWDSSHLCVTRRRQIWRAYFINVECLGRNIAKRGWQPTPSSLGNGGGRSGPVEGVSWARLFKRSAAPVRWWIWGDDSNGGAESGAMVDLRLTRGFIFFELEP